MEPAMLKPARAACLQRLVAEIPAHPADVLTALPAAGVKRRRSIEKFARDGDEIWRGKIKVL